MGKTLSFEEVMKAIADTLKEADGEYVTEVHNKICDPEIKYLGDSLWDLKNEPKEEENKDG